MSRKQILLVFAIICALLACLWMFVLAFVAQLGVKTLVPQTGDRYIFDYVIVGAGTAGSVVAATLAQKTNATVLLLEAGEQFGMLSRIPLLTTFQQKGLNDWAFLSVPQKHSSLALLERRQCLPRGKGLGGSSQLNYMLHFDGYEHDFEHWRTKFNLSNWHWKAIQPFINAANSKPCELLTLPHTYSRITEALQQAEEEFSHDRAWRFRNAVYNIRRGLRYGTYQRFLQPLLTSNRGNLHVVTNALAKRIELQQAAVSSLAFLHARQVFHVEIRKELILSAGTYQTPQLLLASGIGDMKQLKSLKIKSQLHSPQVGKQLHDHFNLPLYVSIDVVGPTLNQRTLLSPWTFMRYLNDGSGPLGNFGVLAHIDDTSKISQEYSLTLFGAGAVDESVLMSISNFKRAHFHLLFPRYFNATQEGFVIISSCLKPQSRGTVSIISSDVRQQPLIDPNYLAVASDVNCTIRAIRAAVELVTSQSFSALKPHIHWPRFRECANFGPFQSDFENNAPNNRYLECIIRHVGLGSHHPGGSCGMGTNMQNGVVDAQFRLFGVKNLRVVDASVLPTPLSGNPNSIITALALRAATMIIKDLRLND